MLRDGRQHRRGRLYESAEGPARSVDTGLDSCGTSGTFPHENRETAFGVCRETDRPVREGYGRTSHAYAGEESDNALVAMKQPNKDGPTSAAAAERSASTEGNAGQSNTGRTPSRESVSNRLHCVRQRAKEKGDGPLQSLELDTAAY